MDLCEFGCGRPAIHTQKNGKRICSDWVSKCPAMRKKNGDGNRGRECTWGDKISVSNIKTKSTQTHVAWNKGLSKENTPSLMARSDELKRRGEENRQKIIPTDDPVYSDFAKYRNRITYRTSQTYKKNKDIINPTDLTIGTHGENVYHVDHKYPVSEGFKYNVPIEIMSSCENLQLLPYDENVKKSNVINEIPESIKQFLKEQHCDT